MIVTHTQNAAGQRRIYLGGKGSLECWIDPDAATPGWSFHLTEAVAGNLLSDTDKRAWAVYMLMQLAAELNVPPDDLAAVPFEVIAALHNTDPFAGRRIATPRRKAIDAGYHGNHSATSPARRRISRHGTTPIPAALLSEQAISPANLYTVRAIIFGLIRMGAGKAEPSRIKARRRRSIFAPIS